MAKQRADKPNRFHSFLRRLRAGGRTNMYGAIPYLVQMFGVDREAAFRIVCEWVDLQDGIPAQPSLFDAPAPIPEPAPPAAALERGEPKRVKRRGPRAASRPAPKPRKARRPEGAERAAARQPERAKRPKDPARPARAVPRRDPPRRSG